MWEMSSCRALISLKSISYCEVTGGGVLGFLLCNLYSGEGDFFELDVNS